MTNEILVTIITACYNSEKFLEQCIESALAQSYQNFELILVNDCSTDKTKSICNSYKLKDKRIKVIHLEENVGPGKARNEGLKIAKGKYVTFLDSDDLFSDDKLYIQVSLMHLLDLKITHTDYGYIHKGEVTSTKFSVSKFPIGFYNLLARTEMSCLTTMYELNKFKSFQFPEIRRKQDYVHWLNILKTGVKSVPIPVVTGYYRQGGKTKMMKKLGYILSHYKLLRSKPINLNKIDSIKYTTLFFINGTARYLKFIK